MIKVLCFRTQSVGVVASLPILNCRLPGYHLEVQSAFFCCHDGTKALPSCRGNTGMTSVERCAIRETRDLTRDPRVLVNASHWPKRVGNTTISRGEPINQQQVLFYGLPPPVILDCRDSATFGSWLFGFRTTNPMKWLLKQRGRRDNQND